MDDGQESEKSRVLNRTSDKLKPLLTAVFAGGFLDDVDLVTLGPVGLSVGLLAGGAVGWWLAPSLGFSKKRKWLGAVMSGLYCMMPLTSVLPLAAVGAGLAQALKPPQEKKPGPDGVESRGPVIEAEFTKVPQDEGLH